VSLALRPVTEADLPVVEQLTFDPAAAGEFEYFGWFDQRLWRRRFAENGLISPDGGVLMVVDDAERLGFVSWRRHSAGVSAHSFELGIALLPGARGQGHGTLAHLLLARYLFAHTPVHRLFASTDVLNIAEQRALEKAGFSREGVARGAAWRDAAWRDAVMYSLLRTDPPA
jgi:RimJ/RimL family protein N-acetyltransferase